MPPIHKLREQVVADTTTTIGDEPRNTNIGSNRSLTSTMKIKKDKIKSSKMGCLRECSHGTDKKAGYSKASNSFTLELESIRYPANMVTRQDIYQWQVPLAPDTTFKSDRK